MSKSDLQIRPIYHYTKRRIEAHISISFVAYTVYKELERLLYKHHAPFSIATATDLVKTMYQLEITLPDSKQTEKILLNMDEEQKILLQIIHDELG
jgi:transposase